MDDRAPSDPGVSSGSPESWGERASEDSAPRDDDLVASAQRGDCAAFSLLVERHQRIVYGFLRSRLAEAADAEDLCQEVFIRCYQTKAHFDSPAMVRPWLIGIARNVLREHARRVHRRKEVAWTTLCLEVDELCGEPCDLYDDVVDILPGCMESLGQSARDALEMHYRSKLRLAQIGQRLKRSEGAVKLLMYRARQALKNCLTKKACGGSRQ
jgi:RNA polymerase sigma-70 factor (ECF subfamily)